MKIDILKGCVGLEYAIPAMRNSWKQYKDKSDSGWEAWDDSASANDIHYVVGDADRELARKLCIAGPSHRKFLRMIFCYADITAPLYWWKQFDTHRLGVEKISESTMHSILVKPFEVSDFEEIDISDGGLNTLHRTYLEQNIAALNILRNKALSGSVNKGECERVIYTMLPDSYLQRRTVCMSYEAMYAMYDLRRGHKLGEWKMLCDAFMDIPEFNMFAQAIKKTEIE